MNKEEISHKCNFCGNDVGHIWFQISPEINICYECKKNKRLEEKLKNKSVK